MSVARIDYYQLLFNESEFVSDSELKLYYFFSKICSLPSCSLFASTIWLYPNICLRTRDTRKNYECASEIRIFLSRIHVLVVCKLMSVERQFIYSNIALMWIMTSYLNRLLNRMGRSLRSKSLHDRIGRSPPLFPFFCYLVNSELEFCTIHQIPFLRNLLRNIFNKIVKLNIL